MRKLCSTAALGVVALALLGAGAGRADIADCGGSNVEMTACIWEHYEAADAELNALWPEVLAVIDGSSDIMPASALSDWRAGLIKAQRAWAEFKEADCNIAVAHEWYGGSGASAASGSCRYEHTQDRIEELRTRYLAR